MVGVKLSDGEFEAVKALAKQIEDETGERCNTSDLVRRAIGEFYELRNRGKQSTSE